MLPEFPERKIAIVLTGEEWFALLAKLSGKPLSRQGRGAIGRAINTLAAKLAAESSKSGE